MNPLPAQRGRRSRRSRRPSRSARSRRRGPCRRRGRRAGPAMCSWPQRRPVRPNPVITSSAMSRMSWRRQRSSTARQYSSPGARQRSGGAGDRLEQEPGDRRRALALDHRRQRVGVVPRDVGEVEQQRLVAPGAVAVAADGEGAERQPVVARVAADDLPPLRAAARQVVRPGQAQRRVGRLAAAAGEEHVAHAGGQPALDEHVVEALAVRGRPDRHDVGRRRPSRRARRRRPRSARGRCWPRSPRRRRRGCAARRRSSSQQPVTADDRRPPGPRHELDPVGVVGLAVSPTLRADGRFSSAWPRVGGSGHQRGSRGRPSTRSPRMLRITFDVPPMIV